MDDLSEKLAQLLNDPESLNQMKQMAESLMGSGESKTETESEQDGYDINSILKVLNMLKSSGNDDRTRLLTALKPHLSEPKRDKVDTAIKVLKILDMLPLLKESGILNNLI